MPRGAEEVVPHNQTPSAVRHWSARARRRNRDEPVQTGVKRGDLGEQGPTGSMICWFETRRRPLSRMLLKTEEQLRLAYRLWGVGGNPALQRWEEDVTTVIGHTDISLLCPHSLMARIGGLHPPGSSSNLDVGTIPGLRPTAGHGAVTPGMPVRPGQTRPMPA